ncbi:Xaa-Pro aminopeptidase [Syntrophus gentianae]|uniref:Xaa-Pro aminopeptidase n=1 Tax=Syntrophus gentianae TaxID=43775 RepID=A0A1H7WHN2_9BACT|nr:Xaa-Pro peptidase family protein [Syntrophus gentianae]SEM20518.1 Xaa-Pro aminopeptidase [Syntrophus gentianae]
MRTGTETCELTPHEEIQSRINRFKEKMAGADIHFSIIMGNVDLFYFSGTTQRGILVIPLESDPLLFVERNQERARRESPLTITPIAGHGDVHDILSGKGILRGRGGMELDILPVSTYERFRRICEVDSFADLSPLIREVRMVKSAFEIRQMKRSGKIMDAVFSRAREVIQEGMREIDVEAELNAEGRRRGHQGLLRMRGFNQEMMCLYVISGQAGTLPTAADVTIAGLGVTHALPQGSSLNVIQRNQPVILDYGAGYNGYITDETRAFVIGSLNEKLARAYDVSREIIEETAAFAREGTETTRIFEFARNRARAAKLDEYFMGYGEGKVGFIGHGLGLELNEIPVITARHRQTLTEGMVFALEPKFVFPGEGSIGIEADFIVRKETLERITKTPLDLVCL